MTDQKISFDALDCVTSVEAARRGDMEPLAERVMSGRDLTQEEREVIAKHLTGKLYIDRLKAQSEKKKEEKIEIAKYVELIMAAFGGPKYVAVKEVAEFMGCSIRKVEAAYAVCANDEKMRLHLKRAQSIGERFKEARVVPQN